MKLLEIVRGRATSKEVIATSLRLAKQLNKVGVVVGNCFGFVANRMLAYYMREAVLAAQGRRQCVADRQSSHRFRIAGRTVRDAIHRGHRRGLAHSSAPAIPPENRVPKGHSPRFPIASTKWAVTVKRPVRDGIHTKAAVERAFRIRSSMTLAADEARTRGVTRRAGPGR